MSGRFSCDLSLRSDSSPVKLFFAGDLKVFLPGAGVALATGLLLGGAMQPHLDDNRPAGPQMLADQAGPRSGDTVDPGVSLAAYHGNPPDYVLGTDQKRSMTWPAEQAAVSDPRESVTEAPASAEDRPVITRATYESPKPSHAYPSMGAGAAAAADAGVNDDTLPTVEG